jgi:hypothetical protein
LYSSSERGSGSRFLKAGEEPPRFVREKRRGMYDSAQKGQAEVLGPAAGIETGNECDSAPFIGRTRIWGRKITMFTLRNFACVRGGYRQALALAGLRARPRAIVRRLAGLLGAGRGRAVGSLSR